MSLVILKYLPLNVLPALHSSDRNLKSAAEEIKNGELTVPFPLKLEETLPLRESFASIMSCSASVVCSPLGSSGFSSSTVVPSPFKVSSSTIFPKLFQYWAALYAEALPLGTYNVHFLGFSPEYGITKSHSSFKGLFLFTYILPTSSAKNGDPCTLVNSVPT